MILCFFSIKKKTMKKRVMIRKFVLKVDTFRQWKRTWLLYFSSKAILQIFAFISARNVGIGKLLSAFTFFNVEVAIITWQKKMRVLGFFSSDCLWANMNNCLGNDFLLRLKMIFKDFFNDLWHSECYFTWTLWLLIV